MKSVATETSPKIRICVFQHFQCDLPDCFSDRSIYIPIQCGRSLHPPIPNTVGDDTGENISSLNSEFSELTALYWVAKHYSEIGDPEHIGFAHYRRALEWTEDDLKPNVVVARKWFSWRPLHNQYACCHNITDLDKFLDRLVPMLSEADKIALKAYSRSHGFFICNMFILHKSHFMRYGDFLLRCTNILQEMIADGTLDLSHYDAMARRTPGYILEWITSYWIFKECHNGNLTLHKRKIKHFDIANKTNSSTHTFHGFLWQLRQAY